MCICIRIYGTDVEEEENGKDRLYSLLSIITIRRKKEKIFLIIVMYGMLTDKKDDHLLC